MTYMKHIKKFNESKSEKTVKYRDHSGSLESSLKSIKEVTEEQLEKHLKSKYTGYEGFKIKEYMDKEDSRSGFKKTYLVQIKIGDSYFPVGYSDNKF